MPQPHYSVARCSNYKAPKTTTTATSTPTTPATTHDHDDRDDVDHDGTTTTAASTTTTTTVLVPWDRGELRRPGDHRGARAPGRDHAAPAASSARGTASRTSARSFRTRVEEAYELADAANRRDDAKLLDELGDVLFQVHFLALLLEERGAGDLAAVARHATEKLIRRHPHVFGETEVENAAEVLRNWDAIKATEAGREPGVFGEVPENLPGPLYARKVQRRAASTGFDFEGVEQPLQSVRDELDELIAAETDDERFHELGDVLFAAVNVARKLDARSGAGAARRGRPLPWPRAGWCRSRRIARPKLERSCA